MEIEKIREALVKRINKIEDEQLLWKISTLITNSLPRPTLQEIYQEITSQYGNTLQRLAESEWQENKRNNN